MGSIVAKTVSQEQIIANRPHILKLYRSILREINKGAGNLTYAARERVKREVKGHFVIGAKERYQENINDLLDTGNYVLEQLRKGYIPEPRDNESRFKAF